MKLIWNFDEIADLNLTVIAIVEFECGKQCVFLQERSSGKIIGGLMIDEIDPAHRWLSQADLSYYDVNDGRMQSVYEGAKNTGFYGPNGELVIVAQDDTTRKVAYIRVRRNP